MRHHKKLSEHFETKKQIAQLKMLVDKNQRHDIQLNLIKKILKDVPTVGIDVFNREIFRARWHEKGALFRHEHQLIYPPSNIIKKGRFNNVNESIFYAADCELGAITELRPDINRFFTITKFAPINEYPFFFPLGMADRFSPPNKLNKTESMIHDFIKSEATKIAKHSDEYNLTILIAKVFYSNIIGMRSKKITYGGIAYPSVQSKLISNKKTHNFAMKPDFYHHHFSIVDTTLYVLINRSENYILLPINHGTLNENKNIIWKYGYDEMKLRVKTGLLLDDSTCKEITIIDESL